MKDPTGPHPESLQERGDVGYGRPPLAFRWKAGQSGNPRGRRPKGSATPAQASADSAIETKIGYRCPPRHARRKPGLSGNPADGGQPGPRAKSVASLEKAALPSDTEEKVGYRQPPRHSRWKPGQTGNPRGLPPRDILREVLMSPFPIKIGAKTEMAPALDVMLLRIRARALAGDQQVIRSLIEHFGSGTLTKELVRRSGDPELIRQSSLERARPTDKRSSGWGDEGAS